MPDTEWLSLFHVFWFWSFCFGGGCLFLVVLFVCYLAVKGRRVNLVSVPLSWLEYSLEVFGKRHWLRQGITA